MCVACDPRYSCLARLCHASLLTLLQVFQQWSPDCALALSLQFVEPVRQANLAKLFPPQPSLPPLESKLNVKLPS